MECVVFIFGFFVKFKSNLELPYNNLRLNMITLTPTERKALLVLSKDYTAFYNANSLSKTLDISHVGTQKLLKRFKNEGLVESKKIGKSIVYKPKYDNDYNRKLIAFLMADEAIGFKRWKEEFKAIDTDNTAVILFGSIVKAPEHAKDIDLLVIADKDDPINNELNRIAKLQPKPLHILRLTKEEFLKNIQSNNKAMIDIVRNGIVLYGQDKYVEVLKNVAGF
jgi:predicted nucleotidyltransferase